MPTAQEKSHQLKRVLLDGGAVLAGFADLRQLRESSEGYASGICFALPYEREGIDPLPHDDPFLAMAKRISRKASLLYDVVEQLLENWGHRHAHISSHLPADELPDLSERLPQKTVATLAGLGWIGKSTLLVSPDHGARIRLSVVVTDAVLAADRPVVRSRCGDCRMCVDACPVGAIRNRNWSQEIDRSSLIDIECCNEHLRETIETLGRKQVCGLCLKACPIGRR
jgi:epoxyqueuosine reductase QueG